MAEVDIKAVVVAVTKVEAAVAVAAADSVNPGMAITAGDSKLLDQSFFHLSIRIVLFT